MNVLGNDEKWESDRECECVELVLLVKWVRLRA